MRARSRIAAATATVLVAILAVLGSSAFERQGRRDSLPAGGLPVPPDVRLRGAGPAEPPQGVVDAAPREVAEAVAADDSEGQVVVGGRVLGSDDGEAVEGAWVFVPLEDAREIPTHRAATTGDDGVFRLTVDRHDPSWIRVQAPGYLPQDAPLPAVNEMPEILLHRGASIRGVVVADSGEPLAGARVWCALPSNRVAWPNVRTSIPASGPAAGSEAVSSTNGEFVLEGLDASREYVLRGAKPGWGDRSRARRVVPTGETASIVLCPTATLSVSCMDAATGLPVTAVSLLWSTPRGFSQLSTTAYARATGALPAREDPSHLTIRLLRTDPGVDSDRELTLRFRACGFGYQDERGFVRLRLAEAQDATVLMRPLASTRLGSVRFSAAYPGGLPYSGYLVLRCAGGAGPVPGSVEIAFDEGRSERAVLLPAGALTVRIVGARKSGFWWKPAGPPAEVLVEGASGVQAIRLVVEGNEVRLDVRDPAGRRVRGFDVEVFREGRSRGSWSIWDVPRWEEEGRALPRFPALMLPPGTSRVEVRVPELGAGSIDLALSGDGVPRECLVRLGPEASDRARRLEDFERRLRERFGR